GAQILPGHIGVRRSWRKPQLQERNVDTWEPSSAYLAFNVPLVCVTQRRVSHSFQKRCSKKATRNAAHAKVDSAQRTAKTGSIHSSRRAAMGSRLAARSAGRKLAARATAPSSAAAMSN